MGLSNVLNTGIEMAKGKYIARMDSDDLSSPNRLEVQVNYLEEHPDIDLCSCGMSLFGAMASRFADRMALLSLKSSSMKRTLPPFLSSIFCA